MVQTATMMNTTSLTSEPARGRSAPLGHDVGRPRRRHLPDSLTAGDCEC